MKVNETGGVDAVRAYTSQLKKGEVKARAKAGAGDSAPADRLEISSEAKRMQYYKELLDKVPAVREELVAQLKKKIEEGTYRADSEKIADGIIRDRLMKDKVD